MGLHTMALRRAVTKTGSSAAWIRKSATARTFCSDKHWNLFHNRHKGEQLPFHVQTFNAIAPEGLAHFPSDYDVSEDSTEPHAIMLRSHKLQVSDVPKSVRAIARCGAGTNNIPVADMTSMGIPVFNTPGANANAVKELVLCSLLLSSRGVYEGCAHMKT